MAPSWASFPLRGTSVGIPSNGGNRRGRDGGCPPPPAQTRACGTTAHGSYLGFAAVDGWRQNERRETDAVCEGSGAMVPRLLPTSPRWAASGCALLAQKTRFGRPVAGTLSALR